MAEPCGLSCPLLWLGLEVTSVLAPPAGPRAVSLPMLSLPGPRTGQAQGRLCPLRHPLLTALGAVHLPLTFLPHLPWPCA